MKQKLLEFIAFLIFISFIIGPIIFCVYIDEYKLSKLYYGKVDIERVFQQYPGTYSFLYKKDGQILNFNLSEYRIDSYKVFDDVKVDDKIYIDLVKNKNNGTTINIHIHSVKEIGTEAYVSGKTNIYSQVIEL